MSAVTTSKTKEPIEYVLGRLVLEDKTVRDPVHGDIVLNHLEVPIIDTELFQRLRRIRQLGTAHFVYPGAEHSRFQHSLGVLQMAETLLQSIKKNRFSDHQIFGDNVQDMFFGLVVRLAALIHDLQEYPLSHVLEKEGRIFEKQWYDVETNIAILGIQGAIFKAITAKITDLLTDFQTEVQDRPTDARDTGRQKTLGANTTSTAFDRENLSAQLAATILAYAYKIVKGPKEKVSLIAQRFFGDDAIVISGLFVEKYIDAANQIVSNTISADLLDYATRDFLFCGIEKRYDERFLKYAVVADSSDGPVFAYRLISKRNEIKSSVLSSLFDVLELRCTLAEFVHTHRTKNAFSAMAIEAFSFHYHSLESEARKQLVEKIMWMGDDELLSYLREVSKPSKHILNYYFSRLRYNEFVLGGDFSDVESEASKMLWNAEERLFLERCLVGFLRTLPQNEDLVDGDILLYAMPSPKQLYKELETYVVYLDQNGNPTTEKMNSIAVTKDPYPSRKTSLSAVTHRIQNKREELIRKYEGLWRTTLYLSPKVNTSPATVAMLIEHLFQIVHPERRGPQKEPLPSELYERVVAYSQGEHRRFENFKELFETLTS
jgi:HD superfamily phosphohydrolase